MATELKDVRTSTDKAIDLIQTMRALNSEMPIQLAEIFLLIARKPGITMKELVKATGLAQSSISRNVSALSLYHRLDKPGLGLVDVEMDVRDTRRRLLFLTADGRMFYTKVMRALEPNFSLDRDTDARLEARERQAEAEAEAMEILLRARAKARS